ncbi:MAG: response regulator transcription factor [Eubacterium sp.]|nr:response regulator transcription factor [Eubacterium sp.]MBR0398139.1 response regulator transcription factor [Eubacterium sp.]
MDPYTILICDDKEAVHESLGYFLNKEGMQVISAYDGESVLLKFSAHKIDLIVLDVMLPGMDGTEVCRIIRRESDVPIIFLSAKGEEMDRIKGLEIGGDDYVTKPFSPREIALRIKILLNRRNRDTGGRTDETAGNASGNTSGGRSLLDEGAFPAGDRNDRDILQYQELQLNQATMQVFVGDEQIEMTAREVSLLSYLMNNPNRVLNREQILNAVWGFDYYGETRAVDAVVKRIRKKLPKENVHFQIQSIYGVGYRLGDLSS